MEKVQNPGRFALSIIMFSLLIVGKAAHASPCGRLKSEPDTWSLLFLRANAATRGEDGKDATLVNTARNCRLHFRVPSAP